MSKKRKAIIPLFGNSRASGNPNKPGQPVATQKTQPSGARVKPQSIPVKSSGHRGP